MVSMAQQLNNARPPGPRVSQMFPRREKFHPSEIYVSGGGLHMASIIEPHLFNY